MLALTPYPVFFCNFCPVDLAKLTSTVIVSDDGCHVAKPTAESYTDELRAKTNYRRCGFCAMSTVDQTLFNFLLMSLHVVYKTTSERMKSACTNKRRLCASQANRFMLTPNMSAAKKTLDKGVTDRYMDLDQGECVLVQYVWIDGTDQGLRAKTMTLNSEPRSPQGQQQPPCLHHRLRSTTSTCVQF